MTQIDENYPQFINIDETRKIRYLEPLVKNTLSPFFGNEEGDVYCMAVALGFKNGNRIKTDKIKNIRLYSKLDPKYKLLFRIIAITAEKYNYDIVENGSYVLKLIEEYANAGVEELYETVLEGRADFSFEDEFWEEIKGNKSE